MVIVVRKEGDNIVGISFYLIYGVHFLWMSDVLLYLMYVVDQK